MSGAFTTRTAQYTMCLQRSSVGAGDRCVGASSVVVVLLSPLPTPPGQRGMERMNAVVQGLVLRRLKSDLGINGKELVSMACAATPSPNWHSRFVWGPET